MPFDWNDFLSLAQRLAASTDEASKRTAISRAYYCAFILAFERAESAGCRYPRGEGYHQWCWRKYSETPDSSCRKLAVEGNRMLALRVRADYEAGEIRRLDDTVLRVLGDTQQFMADLAALNPRYPLP
ncbi:MAG: hypothetical protein DMG21_16040 [Acidobacteria bacterium]|nr:MAG: hypothetical protein DMG21_16040 [Acidobacteriota bacterium]